jgi:transcriptional regulator with XRE-family HTH domain
VTTIKKLREGKGWTQAELAVHANVSFPTISRTENGHPVSKTSVRHICQALGVDVAQVEGVTIAQRGRTKASS